MENNNLEDYQNAPKNNKEDKRESKKFLIIVFLLLILISIGYATLSSTLRINGGGTIGKIRWDVHFENISQESNKAQIITPATINGNTTNIEYKVNLTVPGSYYQFETDIKNGGTIDAKLATPPTLTGITAEQDVYTNYTVTYSDGTPILVGDVIKAGQSRRVLVKVELEKDVVASQLPATEQTLNLSVDLDYIQAD